MMDFSKGRYLFYLNRKLIRKEKELYGVTELKEELAQLRLKDGENSERIKAKERLRKLHVLRGITVMPEHKFEVEETDHKAEATDSLLTEITHLDSFLDEYLASSLPNKALYIQRVITESTARLFRLLLLFASEYLNKGIPPELLFSDQEPRAIERMLLVAILRQLEHEINNMERL
jgi:hypothetical protein